MLFSKGRSSEVLLQQNRFFVLFGRKKWLNETRLNGEGEAFAL